MEAPEIMEAIATQIRSTLGTAIYGLNVYPLLTFNPSTPAVDVYPADPFYQQTAYTLEASELAFNVRARVNGDQQSEQRELIRMMDPQSDTSLAGVLHDTTLGTAVAYVACEPPSDYQIFIDPGGTGEGLLGCTWRLRVGL